jgi:hypothetical protein
MKDTRELRAFLVSQMQGVVKGDVNPEMAKSISNLSQQIYNTLNVEVKLAMAKAKLGQDSIDAVSFGD